MKVAPNPAQTDVFDSGARARSSDPKTSKEAAASVQNMRASHKRVLAMFRAYGGMTDETLAAYLDEAAKETGMKLMSPSGVRSRRSELSKPNQDRLDEMAEESALSHVGHALTFGELPGEQQTECRARLLIEGIRSPLWDSGRRETLASGRQAIVWGMAR